MESLQKYLNLIFYMHASILINIKQTDSAFLKSFLKIYMSV